MEINITLPHKFKPYPTQAKAMSALDRGVKHVILPWSRRQGKDMFAINVVICQAMQHRGQYFYMFPSAEQARKAIFEGFTNDGERILNFIPEELIKTTRINKLQIELINGSFIEFIGSDEAQDKLAGTNPRGVVFSEAALSKEEAWTVAVRPILMGNDGWALFISTKRGDNWFNKLCNLAQFHPEWYHSEVNVIDTGSMSPSQILKEVATLNDNMGVRKMLQELFNVVNKGSDTCYFEEDLEMLRKKGQIGEFKYDPRYPIHTSWDIGIVDQTTCWCFQYIEDTGRYRFLHYFETVNKDIGHDLQILETWVRNRSFGYMFLPHDGGRRNKADLRTLRDVVEDDYDYDNVEVVKRPSNKNTCIELAHSQLPKCEFDISNPAVREALEQMESYHEKVVKNRQTGQMIRLGKPEHDKSSNCMDGWFTFGTALGSDIIDNNVVSRKDIQYQTRARVNEYNFGKKRKRRKQNDGVQYKASR